MQRASAYPRRWLGLVGVLLFALAWALGAPTRALAQPTPQLDENASGTYYIVGWPDTTANALDSRYPNNRVVTEASIWIFSAVKNKVKISSAVGGTAVLNLEPGKFKTYKVTASPVIDVSNSVTKKTFKIEADFPVVVYCYWANIQSCEAWTPLPVQNWGTTYYAACVPGEIVREIGIAGETEVPDTPKPGNAEILVMAAYDNTKVTITPPPGVRFIGAPPSTITLNEGEAFQVQSRVDTNVDADNQDDLAAALIQSDKPVGVMSGNTRVQVVVDEVGLKNNAYKNMFMECLAPVEQHGNDFVFMPTWDNHRPGIGASAERKREFVRVYNTSGKKTPMKGYYLESGDNPNKVPFSIKTDTIYEAAFGAPAAIYFHTNDPAQAMMHSSAIVKFNGSTPCFRGLPCLSYSAWAGYMVEMVPRQQWTTFAPYYAPPNPGTMIHFVSVVTDTATANAKKIIREDGSSFLFQRPIPGTDLIWGTRSINPGVDNWLMSKDSNTFSGVAFGEMEGGEEYRPGRVKKKDGGDVVAGGGSGAPRVEHPCEYEEYNAVAYGYPLAPARRVLKPGDTLRIDTVMDCSTLTITIRAINANPVGLRSITLDPTSIDNAKLTPVNPDKLSDIIGKASCVIKVEAIDPLKNASATVIIKDRTGKTWKIYYKYEAEFVTTNPDKELNWGTVNLNTPTSKSLTFTNPLTRPIHLKDIVLAVGRDYKILDIQPRKPATDIAPGETFTITIEVNPSQDNQRYVDTVKIITQCTMVPVVLITETAKPCIYVDNLDFQQFIVKGDGPKTLTLQVCNNGSGVLQFIAPYVTFPPASGYVVDPADMTTLQTLALKPSECFTLHVTFTPPQVVGEYDIVAKFHTNASCERDTSQWFARVVEPGPQISPYDWKEQWVTTSNTCTKDLAPSYPADVMVNNIGNVDANVVSVFLADQDAVDGYFKLDSSGGSGTYIRIGDVIAQGNTKQLHQAVLFLPKDARPYTATICVVTQTGTAPLDTIKAKLLGKGIESHGMVTNAKYDTAEFKGLNSVNQPKIVTIHAMPTRPLTITDVQVVGPDAGNYQIDRTSFTVPKTLAIGDSMPVRIFFNPVLPGQRNATVMFIGDHSRCDDSTNTLEGYTYTRGVDVRGIDFGTKLSCADSIGYVQITNTGTEDVLVRGAVLDDKNKPEVFKMEDNSSVLGTLAPGETKLLKISFADINRVGTWNAQVLFDVINSRDSTVVNATPAQITLKTYIIQVHAFVVGGSGPPGATITTPVALQEPLDDVHLTQFFIGVYYNNQMMQLTNGTTDPADLKSMLKGTIVDGWNLQIVESDHPEGEYLAVITSPDPANVYLKGTGKLLNPQFQLFLGTTDSGKISFYILPVGKQCARIIPTPGMARVDSVCGLNLRLIESSGFNYSLAQNKPNPFNPSTDITFSLGLDGPTKLTLYDESGKKVATLVDGYMKPGTYQVTWDATGFPSGLYYYRLESGVWTRTSSMILRK